MEHGGIVAEVSMRVAFAFSGGRRKIFTVSGGFGQKNQPESQKTAENHLQVLPPDTAIRMQENHLILQGFRTT